MNWDGREEVFLSGLCSSLDGTPSNLTTLQNVILSLATWPHWLDPNMIASRNFCSGGGTSLRWKDCCRPGTAVSNEKKVNVSFTWLFECCRLETGFCCARYNHDYIIIRCFWTQGSNLCIISLQRVKYLGKKDTWELKKLQKNPARDVKLLLETEEVMVRDSR